MNRVGGVIGAVVPPINEAKLSSVWRLSELRAYRTANRAVVQAKMGSVPFDLPTTKFSVHKTTQGTIS
jgi:hypothetical protein